MSIARRLMTTLPCQLYNAATAPEVRLALAHFTCDLNAERSRGVPPTMADTPRAL
jgi:hypothetical protein